MTLFSWFLCIFSYGCLWLLSRLLHQSLHVGAAPLLIFLIFGGFAASVLATVLGCIHQYQHYGFSPGLYLLTVVVFAFPWMFVCGYVIRMR